uniref:Uncharacterized protein n=1 Tax=Arcella intermedia TaxID=1963864 RepID=A0A6B2L9I6_9EUKA
MIGTGGSGKSTFCKQMQILHDQQQTLDAALHKSILLSNIIIGLQERIHVANKNDIETSEENRKIARHMLELNPWDIQWTDKLLGSAKKLYEDKFITELTKIPDVQLQIPEMEYLMARIDDFYNPEYVPSASDILRARQRTTGNHSVSFCTAKHKWTLIDLGGQFSEREKWVNILGATENLDNVKSKPPFAFIAFIALDDYDVKSVEDPAKTKFVLSLEVIAQFARNPEAANLCPLLFLNKNDIFKTKIASEKGFASFKANFPDFQGEQTYDDTFLHIKTITAEYFQREANLAEVPIFGTCALDAELMSKVFEEAQGYMFKRLLSYYGL